MKRDYNHGITFKWVPLSPHFNHHVHRRSGEPTSVADSQRLCPKCSDVWENGHECKAKKLHFDFGGF